MAYKSKLSQYPGSSYEELVRQARIDYHAIHRLTPRRKPYIKSKYFGKEKVFVNLFWEHLNQKSRNDRRRRLKLFACAIDLIRNSREKPEIIHEAGRPKEIFYRFQGASNDNKLYVVQIKENKKTKRKYFMSVFPTEK